MYTNFVGLHPMNIHTKFEENTGSSLIEEWKKLEMFTTMKTKTTECVKNDINHVINMLTHNI